MFLLIDAGNTRIKFGSHDGRDWLLRDALRHADISAFHLPDECVPQRVLVANVAGAEVAQALRTRLAVVAPGVPVEFLRAEALRCGLRNGYANPAQLGADRWAALVGAWRELGRACLVVSAGTATTVDFIDADARFAGGCILPGLDMMRASLAGGTANLPLAEGAYVAHPDNTLDAIASGCLNAQLGAIDRMRMPANLPLVLTGGAADALTPLLPGEVLLRPWLVLDGLLQLARET